MVKIGKSFLFFGITICCFLSITAQVDQTQKKVTINFGAIKKQPDSPKIDSPLDYKINNKEFKVSIEALELPENPKLLSPKAQSGLNLKSNLDFNNFGKLSSKKIAFGKPQDTHRYITSQKPRFLKQYEGGKQGVFTDQDLGDIITTSKYAIIRFKDYGQVDGDIIRLLINDDIKLHRISLNRNFSEIKLILKEGFNKIDFLALNVGLFAPNTAQLKIIDDKGSVLHNDQWALSTGFKATMVLIKQ